MADMVIGNLAFALADAIGLELVESETSHRLIGAGVAKIELPGLVAKMPMKVVSALIRSSRHMLIVRCAGNLHLVVDAHENAEALTTTVLAIDGAKVPHLEGWLERRSPKTIAEVEGLMADGVAGRMKRIGSKPFKAA